MRSVKQMKHEFVKTMLTWPLKLIGQAITFMRKSRRDVRQCVHDKSNK